MTNQPASTSTATTEVARRQEEAIISVSGLSKVYGSGFRALDNIDLDIRAGEIFALLGPNGAGKTTLISIVCGIVNPTSGRVTADGHDVVRDYRAARTAIGLVPQELFTDAFETVWATVSFSRGLFGKAPDRAYVEKVLRDLSLWDKKDAKIDAQSEGTGIAELMRQLSALGIDFKDLRTSESSLEDIFVSLVRAER